VLGEQNVGKTSILGTLIDNSFDSQSAPTIGIDFRVLRATVHSVSNARLDATPLLDSKEAQEYKLQIWDSAGQYRFRSIVSSYYRLAHIFIIVFDLCDRDTFMYVRDWRKSVDDQRQSSAFLVYLIGNKCDAQRDRVVTPQEIKDLVYELNFDGYFEVSAKNKHGIVDAFKTIIGGAHNAVQKRLITGVNRMSVGADGAANGGVFRLTRKSSGARNFLSQCCG
jgi:Ras-related protein Rab-6A